MNQNRLIFRRIRNNFQQYGKITQIIVRATVFYEIINKTFYHLIEQEKKLLCFGGQDGYIMNDYIVYIPKLFLKYCFSNTNIFYKTSDRSLVDVRIFYSRLKVMESFRLLSSLSYHFESKPLDSMGAEKLAHS